MLRKNVFDFQVKFGMCMLYVHISSIAKGGMDVNLRIKNTIKFKDQMFIPESYSKTDY